MIFPGTERAAYNYETNEMYGHGTQPRVGRKKDLPSSTSKQSIRTSKTHCIRDGCVCNEDESERLQLRRADSQKGLSNNQSAADHRVGDGELGTGSTAEASAWLSRTVLYRTRSEQHKANEGLSFSLWQVLLMGGYPERAPQAREEKTPSCPLPNVSSVRK